MSMQISHRLSDDQLIKINIATDVIRQSQLDSNGQTISDIVNRVVLEAQKYLTDTSKVIDITFIDLSNKRVSYVIDSTEKHDLGEVIPTKAPFIKQNGFESLLERFTQRQPEVKNSKGKIGEILAPFFTTIAKPFKIIESLWDTIIGRTAHRMKWDFALLQDITNTYTSSDEITRTDALKYIESLLAREKKADTAILHKRIDKALGYSRKIDKLRANFDSSRSVEKAFVKLVKDIKEDITSLKENPEDKLLIPVGYIYEKSEFKIPCEMLLEITKSGPETYEVALITRANEERELFGTAGDEENVTEQSIRRVITNIKTNDLLGSVPTLVERQINKHVTLSRTEARGHFLQDIKFKGSILKDVDTKQRYLAGKTIGRVGDIMAYLKEEKGSDAEAFDAAARLHAFHTITTKSERWLKNPEYRQLVLTAGLKLVDHIERHRTEIFGENITEQGMQMTEELARIKDTLRKLEEKMHAPVDIRHVSLKRDGFVGSLPVRHPPSLHGKAETGVLSIQPIVESGPEFKVWNPRNSVISLNQFHERCEILLAAKKFSQMRTELETFIRSLPVCTDPYWEKISPEERTKLSEQIFNLGYDWMEMMVKTSRSVFSQNQKEEVYCALNLMTISHRLATLDSVEGHIPGLNHIMSFVMDWREEEYFQWSAADRESLKAIDAYIHSWNLEVIEPHIALAKWATKERANEVTEPIKRSILQAEIVHAAMKHRKARFARNTADKTMKLEFDPVEKRLYLQSSTRNRILLKYPKEGFRCIINPPENTADIRKEIGTREFVVKPNIGKFDYYNMTKISPVEADIYASQLGVRLINSGYSRKEIVDLLRTQEIATSNTETNIVQAINTIEVYLRSPNLFTRPEAIWHFEQKIFKDHHFALLLEGENFEKFKPFILSTFRQFTSEINSRRAVQDYKSASSIALCLEKMKEYIEANPKISQKNKDEILSVTPMSSLEYLQAFTFDLHGKQTIEAVKNTAHILTAMVNEYVRKIQLKGDVSWISNQDLLMMTYSHSKLVSLGGQIDQDFESFETLTNFLSQMLPRHFQNETALNLFVKELMGWFNPGLPQDNTTWTLSKKPGFPVMQATDTRNGSVSNFDIMTGNFYMGGSRAEFLPRQFQKDPDVKALFPDIVSVPWIVETVGDQLVYTHKSQPDFRIFESRDNIYIQRKKPDNENKWITYERHNFQGTVARVIGDATCWNYKQKTYLFDKEGKDFVATLEPAYDFDNHVDKFRIKYPDGSTYLKAAGTESANFFTLDNPSQVLIRGKSGRAASVEYPYLTLATNGIPIGYTVEKSKVMSKTIAGWELVGHGEKPNLSGLPASFNAYQLLSKGGLYKVLITAAQVGNVDKSVTEALRAAEAESGDVHTERTHKFESGPKSVYEYDLDNETGKLKAKSGDAYLYLSYMNAKHSNYADAAFYLAKARQSEGVDSNYEKILSWFEDSDKRSGNGIALALKVSLFKDAMLQQSNIRAHAAGNLDARENPADKMKRLVEIVKLLEVYQNSIQNRQIGLKGVDPAVELSQNELLQAKKLVIDFLTDKGDEVYAETLFLPVKKTAGIAPKFSLPGIEEGTTSWGLENRAVDLWANAGIKKTIPDLKLLDNGWITRNFHSIAQELLTTDKDSIRFKQLAHSVRIAIGPIIKKTDSTQKDPGQVERSSLLRLIAAKENDQMQNLKDFLDLHFGGKFPKMHYPFVPSAGRIYEAASFITSLSDEVPLTREHAVFLREKALTTIATRIANEGNTSQFKQPGRTDYFRAGLYLEVRILDKLIKWMPWGGQALVEDVQKEFGTLLFGKKPFESLENWQKILNEIDQLKESPVTHEWQSIDPVTQPASKPAETNEARQLRFESVLHRLNQEITRSTQVAMSLEETAKTSKDRLKASALQLEQRIAAKPIPEAVAVPSGRVSFDIIGKTALASLNGLFIRKALPKQQVSTTVLDQLKATGDGAAKRIADEHLADLEEYEKTSELFKTEISREKVVLIQSKLTDIRSNLEIHKERLKADLLQAVDRFDTPAGISAMRRITGQNVKPSLEYLISLWRRNEVTKPWSENPLSKLGIIEISKEECLLLDQQITDYMKAKVDLGHLDRTLNVAEEYLSSGEERLPEQLYENLNLRRNYDVAKPSIDSRNFLFIEYTLDIVLRPEQVKTQLAMAFDANSATQLRLGGGKTQIIMPLLAERKANGTNLVTLILPDALYETNRTYLQQTNRELFGKNIFFFDFNRRSDISPETLLTIYSTLLETIDQKGFVATTKNSLLSLLDSYKERQKRLSEFPDPVPLELDDEYNTVKEQIVTMSKIIDLMKTRGDALADEIDTQLYILKEMNYALGTKEKIDTVKTSAACDIMRLLINAPRGSDFHELFKSILTNFQTTISPEQRAAYLEKIAEAFYDQNKIPVSKEVFLSYFADSATATELPEFVTLLKEQDPLLYQKVATVKRLLNKKTGLGLSLSKKGNVNYGRDPITHKWTIPYKASNSPSIGSEFEDEIELISYTLQDYIQNGVSYEDFYKVIATYRKQALEELRGADPDDIKSIDETPSGIAFKQFIGDLDPNHGLSRYTSLASFDNSERVRIVYNFVNSKPLFRLNYCQLQVLNRIEQAADQASSTAEDLVRLFNNFGGFTGTPWNRHTYHDKINTQKTLGDDGRTYALLFQKNVEILSVDIDPENPVGSILYNTDLLGNYQALIDTGAYLNGVSNKEFSQKFLAAAKTRNVPVSEAVYFDDAGTIVSTNSETNKTYPIEIVKNHDLMHQFTLYDQAHTTGADIKQGTSAKALVTIGEDTFIRDLYQSIWRLRQFDKDQTVAFLMSNKVKELILGEEFGSREPTLQDVLRFCFRNEITAEARDNFRAEKGKILGAPSRTMLDLMVKLAIDPKASEHQILQLAKACAPYIIKHRNQHQLYDQYAAVNILEDPLTSLANARQHAVALCAKAVEEIHQADQGLKTYAEGLAKTGSEIKTRKVSNPTLYPTRIETTASGSEKEVQVDTQLQLETEVAIEQLQEQEKNVEKQAQIQNQTLIGSARAHTYHPLNVEMLEKVAAGNTESDVAGAKFLSLHGRIGVFDPRLYTTDSFENMMTADASSQEFGNPSSENFNNAARKVFYTNRRPVTEVMIAKGNDGKLFGVIPTKWQARSSLPSFIHSRKPDEPAVMVVVGAGRPLVLAKSGSAKGDALPFSPEDEKEFYKLYVQTKFFAGEVNYSLKEERDGLRDWLTTQDPKKCRILFEKNILPALPEEIQNEYPHSTLYRIFEGLKKG